MGHNRVDSNACAIGICERFLTNQGFPADIIATMVPLLLPKINNDAISMVANFLGEAPDISIGSAVDILWPAISKIPVLVEGNIGSRAVSAGASASAVVAAPPIVRMPQDDIDDDIEAEPVVTSPAPKRKPIVIDHDIGEPEESRAQRSALYPHRFPPPENIDLHLDMTLKTGLFRVMANGKKPPALNENRIYHLSTPLDSGHKYMSLSGPVLNTQMDLVSYICITHWFGRLSKDRFEQALLNPITMPLERFFSPIPDELRPTKSLSTAHLMKSFTRLKGVVLTFFRDIEEAEYRHTGMVTNLAGTLTVSTNGTVTLSPTAELRTLYLNTKKLVPVNRTAVIKLSSSMARLLALWIAAKPGKLSGRRVYLVQKPMSVLDILKEIHPRDSGKYTKNDRYLLSSAFHELLVSGLVAADIDFRNVKSKESSERLTLATMITIKSHCIGDALATVNDQESTTRVDLDVPSPNREPATQTGRHLQQLAFPRGRANPTAWLEQNSAAIEAILVPLRKAAKKSIVNARKELAGVSDSKIAGLARVFVKAGRENDGSLIQEILNTDPRKDKQSEFETILRSIPLKPAHLLVRHWYADHAATINKLKKILRSSKDPLREAASINKRVYFARLVTPLIAVEKQSDADFFKGMWEAGREGIEQEKHDEWNKVTLAGRRKRTIKI